MQVRLIGYDRIPSCLRSALIRLQIADRRQPYSGPQKSDHFSYLQAVFLRGYAYAVADGSIQTVEKRTLRMLQLTYMLMPLALLVVAEISLLSLRPNESRDARTACL